MKNIIKTLIVVVALVMVIPVKAANYDVKELIPISIKTSIHTNNFSYKEFFFDEKGVYFKGIKNLTDKELPVSITIGLFNRNGKNIGTINYCDSKLSSKEEKEYEILFSKDYFGENETNKDIKYIAVIGDNITCKTKGSRDYIGETVEEMGYAKNTEIGSQAELVLKILGVLGGGLLALFLYSFLFTRRYQNYNGNDVRGAYRRVNEDLKKEREEELRNNPPVEKVFKPDKSDEVLQQEEQAKNENGEDTDLHNMYK